jgi:hypothetical protein
VLKKARLLHITPEAFDKACLKHLPGHRAAIYEACHVDYATEFTPVEVEGRKRQAGLRATVEANRITFTEFLDEAPSLAPAVRQAQQLAARLSHHADSGNIISMFMGR